MHKGQWVVTRGAHLISLPSLSDDAVANHDAKTFWKPCSLDDPQLAKVFCEVPFAFVLDIYAMIGAALQPYQYLNSSLSLVQHLFIACLRPHLPLLAHLEPLVWGKLSR